MIEKKERKAMRELESILNTSTSQVSKLSKKTGEDFSDLLSYTEKELHTMCYKHGVTYN